MNYLEIIDYLEIQQSFHDIEYLRSALNILELHIDPSKVILIAGTNGKGTTAATLQTLLVAASKNVGFYSSPHLEETTERIKFNCIDISKEDFCHIFHKIYEKLKHMQLSHFEYLTMIAAYYFFKYKQNIDYAIFEVGLGGTFDATNVIPHNISVITKIAFDHENILGNSIIDIAKNKFGIISQNNTVFHANFSPAIRKIAKEYSKKFLAKFIKSYDYLLNVDTSKAIPIFHVSTSIGNFITNLPGKRAAENSVLALTVFDHLVKNASNFLGMIKNVYWPGRMEKIVYNKREIYLSGDHNVDGVKSLIDMLKYYHFQNVHFVIGICNDKNHHEMLQIFLDVPNSYLYLTETPTKTLTIHKYEEYFIEAARFVSASQIDTLNEAINNALKNDIIIVTGSLYLIGYIKKIQKGNNLK